MTRMRFLLMVVFVMLATVAFGQEGPVVPVVDWSEVLAYAINTAFVFTLVQVVKGYGPGLPTVAKQLLALAGGPLLMMFAQPALSSALGHPIDLSGLSSALAGLASSVTAMAAFDLAKTAGGK